MTKEFLQSKKFEQKYHVETEQKFLPLFPEKLDRFRLGAVAIEQVYLSHPSEDYHLRLRKTYDGYHASYEATLKDSGARTEAGLQRDMIERPLFSLEQNLSVYLEYTEPEYRKSL